MLITELLRTLGIRTLGQHGAPLRKSESILCLVREIEVTADTQAADLHHLNRPEVACMGLNSPRFTRSSVKLPLLGMGYRRELEKLVAAKYNAEIMATEVARSCASSLRG